MEEVSQFPLALAAVKTRYYSAAFKIFNAF
jgi:hypothetical protein